MAAGSGGDVRRAALQVKRKRPINVTFLQSVAASLEQRLWKTVQARRAQRETGAPARHARFQIIPPCA
jgi:hypothetical protein